MVVFLRQSGRTCQNTICFHAKQACHISEAPFMGMMNSTNQRRVSALMLCDIFNKAILVFMIMIALKHDDRGIYVNITLFTMRWAS
jgi:hypothetical protein